MYLYTWINHPYYDANISIVLLKNGIYWVCSIPLSMLVPYTILVIPYWYSASWVFGRYEYDDLETVIHVFTSIRPRLPVYFIFVAVCVCLSICKYVYQSRACPRDNSSLVQARISRYEPELQTPWLRSLNFTVKSIIKVSAFCCSLSYGVIVSCSDHFSGNMFLSLETLPPHHLHEDICCVSGWNWGLAWDGGAYISLWEAFSSNSRWGWLTPAISAGVCLVNQSSITHFQEREHSLALYVYLLFKCHKATEGISAFNIDFVWFITLRRLSTRIKPIDLADVVMIYGYTFGR